MNTVWSARVDVWRVAAEVDALGCTCVQVIETGLLVMTAVVSESDSSCLQSFPHTDKGILLRTMM